MQIPNCVNFILDKNKKKLSPNSNPPIDNKSIQLCCKSRIKRTIYAPLTQMKSQIA